MQDLLNSRFESQTLTEAIRRFNQLTAPVAAKAVEDTGFYRYGVLLSRNDVGFDASRWRCRSTSSIAACHRARDWPHAMLATATHDHKRGEDTRARLAVLSEIPKIWIERGPRLERGQRRVRGAVIPPTSTCCFKGWSALAAGSKAGRRAGLAPFAERIAEWQQKALREGKLRSSWLTPNAEYEKARRRYAKAILDPETGAASSPASAVSSTTRAGGHGRIR